MLKSSVELIPILDSNYVFVVKNNSTQKAIVIDPGDSSGVYEYLQKNSLQLEAILVTHHHHDHIDGITELKKLCNTRVLAPRLNQNQIPSVDQWLDDQTQLILADFKIHTQTLPGHTLGIMAYHFAAQKWLFSGDVLFGLGCGRLFEGSFEEAYQSLQKLKSYDDSTLVFCTHEYTATNLKFCKEIQDNFPDLMRAEDLLDYEEEYHEKMQTQKSSVPLHLGSEKNCNPFLLAPTVEIFKELRLKRNNFK